MRIGIDARNLAEKNGAGISTYVREIVSRLHEMDQTNEYFLYSHKELTNPIVANDKVHVRIIPDRIGTIWLRYKLPKLIYKDKIDVFWGPSHVLPRRLHNIRTVLTIHDLGLIINPRWGQWYNSMIQNLFMKGSIKEADQVIAISEATKSDIEKYTGLSSEKIECIYNGGTIRKKDINDEIIDHTIQKYGINKKYFLYLGTIEPRKNIESIIKAFEQVNQHNNFQLVIAGGMGWKYQPILQMIKQSGNREDILITGYVSNEEKEALYAKATAFIFPSHYEGFGIPVIEAMARGIPVITAKNSSLPEVGGTCAFYVDDENNYKELALLMEKMVRLSEEERKIIAEESVKNAARFSWDQCAEKTIKLLNVV